VLLRVLSRNRGWALYVYTLIQIDTGACTCTCTSLCSLLAGRGIWRGFPLKL
jgi:hypothetical protein